jgi:hypothetical protein
MPLNSLSHPYYAAVRAVVQGSRIRPPRVCFPAGSLGHPAKERVAQHDGIHSHPANVDLLLAAIAPNVEIPLTRCAYRALYH